MPNPKYQEVRIPFEKMTFTPDVPSTALGANEYNDGLNVEADVRGIRSVAGDITILETVPGTPTYVSGGYRADNLFWFIVATVEGNWWASSGSGWINITPPGGSIVGYTQATNITECWSGTVPIYNDSLNPPMFWPNGASQMLMYSNILPQSISDIVYVDPVTYQIQLSSTLANPPYNPGDSITITGINSFFNGTFTVVSSTTDTIDYLATPAAAYPGGGVGTVSPTYSWNYNSSWKSVYAGWMRLYSTPNVGSILVAGNLTATLLDDTTVTYPVTVQWSQAFGLNQAPLTWTPTVTNVANQLEVPLRGPCVDAFPSNGQLFLCSYWDTVVFSPLNYATTAAPILGVRLYNQGRGLLTSNAWANTDKLVFGVDARDIWVFDGAEFKSLGNQRVKNWFYDQLDQRYTDRLYMVTNTQKNQIEIYYTTTGAYNGVPNKMLAYRYDIDCFNPPRDVSSATFACESPDWYGTEPNAASRTVVYAQGRLDQQLVQKDTGFSFINDTAIDSYFRRDNIKMLKDYSGHVLVHRILPEIANLDSFGIPITPGVGTVTVTVEGANSVGSSPTYSVPQTVYVNTESPWAQINQNTNRVNTLKLSNSSTTNIWICNATTWQFTQSEDDR